MRRRENRCPPTSPPPPKKKVSRGTYECSWSVSSKERSLSPFICSLTSWLLQFTVYIITLIMNFGSTLPHFKTSPKRCKPVGFEACCQWVLLDRCAKYFPIYSHGTEVHLSFCNDVNESFESAGGWTFYLREEGTNWNTQRKPLTANPQISYVCDLFQQKGS